MHIIVQFCVVADHAFNLFEDIVETGDIEDVKTAFKLVYKHWDVSEPWDNPLAMQRACNFFVKRLSNDQDAEFLGTVLTLVAKILPFNHKAGLNLVWLVNQHPIHIDQDVQVKAQMRLFVRILTSLLCSGEQCQCYKPQLITMLRGISKYAPSLTEAGLRAMHLI